MRCNDPLSRFDIRARKILAERSDILSIAFANSYRNRTGQRPAETYVLDCAGEKDTSSIPDAEILLREAPALYDIIDMDREDRPRIVFTVCQSQTGVCVEPVASIDGFVEAAIAWRAGEQIRRDNGSHSLSIYPADAGELSGHELLSLKAIRTLGELRSSDYFAHIFGPDSHLVEAFHHEFANLPNACPVEFLDFHRDDKGPCLEPRILINVPRGSVLRLKAVAS